MAQQYVSIRNLKFLLYELLDTLSLNQYEYHQDYDKESFDMALDAAKQISDQYLFPYYREMDKQKAYYKDGVVHVHSSLAKAINAIGEGGWISATDSYENGGQQMPLSLQNACLFSMYSANCNAAAYAFLTQGAANLIRSFGSEQLNEYYVPQMYSGKWQGTMALTEPQAGSSLSDITTQAIPTEEGYYKL